jgi:hypothetical protein
MSDSRIEMELYGRIFVQLLKAGAIPASIIEQMYAEFDELAKIATRQTDIDHFKALADRASMLLARVDMDLGSPADAAAKDARARFRVVSNDDGGNTAT